MIEPDSVSFCGGVDPAPLWEDIHALAILALRWSPPPPQELS